MKISSHGNLFQLPKRSLIVQSFTRKSWVCVCVSIDSIRGDESHNNETNSPTNEERGGIIGYGLRQTSGNVQFGVQYLFRPFFFRCVIELEWLFTARHAADRFPIGNFLVPPEKNFLSMVGATGQRPRHGRERSSRKKECVTDP